MQIDKENGDTKWWDKNFKEMGNVRQAFQVHEGTKADLTIGYQNIKCQLIFDVKMGKKFRQKSRLVGGRHKTEAPSLITYSSVVSRDSIRIVLKIAALNGLDLLACDI